MARIIFISPYLKGGQDKAKLAHRTKYIATRDGVDLLRSERGSEAATEKQREYILRLVKSLPQSKELAEYEDYLSMHAKDAASDFIDQVWEQFIDSMDERENFLDYISHRPGVRSDGDHGLWDEDGKVLNLSRAVKEVANHPGIVWTPVVSLRREDAKRLGYTDVDNWRTLVNSCAAEIAKGYRIPMEHLRWYAALHEKEKHVHIHMVVFSSDPKEGYLTKEGIRDIKSAFATRVFEQDLLQTYERKTTKGKKVYGYLPPRVRIVVDEIVDELAKDERVAAAYSLWQDMQDEVVRTYTDDVPERVPLSQQKEFKPVRNMVIRETLRLAERRATFEDEDMDDEPGEVETVPPPISGIHKIYEQAERYRKAKKALYDEDTDMDEKQSAIESLEKLWEEGYVIAAHQLGKAYRDGLGVAADWVKAEGWFRKSAERGAVCSAYALGKLLLPVGLSTEAICWLKYAADSGNQYARYTLGKVYLTGENAEKDVDTAVDYLKASAEQGNQYAQYALGKLYLLGQDVPPDRDVAVYYLTLSAEQGNRYAQFFLDRLTDIHSPSVGLAALRMFHHMANIFRDSTAQDSTHMGLRIDCKRRRELQEKRIAMGHKPDDHEDEKMSQTMS